MKDKIPAAGDAKLFAEKTGNAKFDLLLRTGAARSGEPEEKFFILTKPHTTTKKISCQENFLAKIFRERLHKLPL